MKVIQIIAQKLIGMVQFSYAILLLVHISVNFLRIFILFFFISVNCSFHQFLGFLGFETLQNISKYLLHGQLFILFKDTLFMDRLERNSNIDRAQNLG